MKTILSILALILSVGVVSAADPCPNGKCPLRVAAPPGVTTKTSSTTSTKTATTYAAAPVVIQRVGLLNRLRGPREFSLTIRFGRTR